MQGLAYLLLPLLLSILFWRTRQDKQEYERFKNLSSSLERQKAYRKWTLESFLLFGGSSLIGLLILGKFKLLNTLLPAFAKVIPAQSLPSSRDSGSSFMLGILTSVLISGVIVGVFLRIRAQKKKPQSSLVIGDVEALLPRNNKERLWASLLALNAGFSEELFFRLFLPLLIYLVFNNALFALVVATLIFGLVHYYQGWAGVVITMLLGTVLMVIYLATSSIWVVIIIHALIDLNNLILQPWLQKRFLASKNIP